MTPKKKILALLTSVGIIGASSVALARPHGGGGGHGGFFGFGGKRLAKVIHKLDLSEQQEDMLFDLRQDMRKTRKSKRGQHLETLNVLIQELEKPTPDSNQLKASLDKNIELMRQNMHAGVDGFVKFHQSLDDKQRAELVRQMRRMQKRAKAHVRE